MEKAIKSNWVHLGVYMLVNEAPIKAFKFRTKTTHPLLYLASIDTRKGFTYRTPGKEETVPVHEAVTLNLLNPKQFVNTGLSPEPSISSYRVRESRQADIESGKNMVGYIYLDDMKFLGTADNLPISENPYSGLLSPAVRRTTFRTWEKCAIETGQFVPKENPEFKKPPLKAKDFFGNELEVGDTIVYRVSYVQKFLIGKITNITDKNVVIGRKISTPPNCTIKCPEGSLHKS